MRAYIVIDLRIVYLELEFNIQDNHWFELSANDISKIKQIWKNIKQAMLNGRNYNPPQIKCKYNWGSSTTLDTTLYFLSYYIGYEALTYIVDFGVQNYVIHFNASNGQYQSKAIH